MDVLVPFILVPKLRLGHALTTKLCFATGQRVFLRDP
jgi:hypothetical protein